MIVKTSRQVPVEQPDTKCTATLRWRDPGRPIDSSTRCARPEDHLGSHKSISGKEWKDEVVAPVKKKTPKKK